MNDQQIHDWIKSMRAAYRLGILSRWQIRRIEKIPGWTWQEPSTKLITTADGKTIGTLHGLTVQ